MGTHRLGRVLLVALLAGLLGAPARAAVQVEVGAQGAGAGSTTSPVVVPNYVQITFPNGTGSQTVPQGEAGFYAEARVRYAGNGPLTIRWVVDGYPIAVMSRTLTYGTDFTVRSDETGVPLPTHEPGSHAVTLTLDNGTGRRTVIAVPTIRYFVTNPAPLPPSLVPVAPASGSRADPLGLAFRWRLQATGKAASRAVPQRYRVELQARPAGTGGLRASRWRAATAADGLSDAWVPVWGVETAGDRYAVPAADAVGFRGGDHRWRVTAFFDGREPVVSDWVAFTLDEPPEPGKAVIGAVRLAADPVTLGAGAVPGRLSESLGIHLRETVEADRDVVLVVRVQNGAFRTRDDLVLELAQGGVPWVRRFLSALPPATADGGRVSSPYLDVALPWRAPALTADGDLVVRLLRDGREVDRATVSYTVRVSRQVGRFDFAERVRPAPEERGFSRAPLACGVTFSGRVPTLCDRVEATGGGPFSGDGPPTGAITGFRSSAGADGLADDGSLHADAGVPGWFLGEVTDNGYAAWAGAQTRRCTANLRDLAAYADELADRLESGRLRDLPPPPAEATCRGLERTVSRATGGRLTRAERTDLAARARSTARGIRDVVGERTDEGPYPGYPMPLAIHRVLPDGATEPAGWLAGDAVVRVQPGDRDRPVTVGPWTPEEPGLYLASLGGFAPWTEVRVTHPGGLPATLLMGGFEVVVDAYDPGAKPGGALSGTAHLAWRGDTSGAEVPVRFEGVRIEATPDPLVARVTMGTASLQGEPVPLSLGGHGFSLRRLDLDASRATADLDLWYPMPGAVRPVDVPGVLPLERVEIVSGGEFVAERRFPDDLPDLHPYVRPGVFVPYGDDVALKLAGARIVADFSPHLGYATHGGQGPEWQGVALAGGYVRVAVHARSDLALTPGVDESRTGLFETVDPTSAYLYGRFARLELATDGRLTGEIEVVPAAEAPAFFGVAPSAEPLRLEDPAGFELAVDGGVFALDGDGVGGLSLAGEVRLPAAYAAQPVRFQNLGRVPGSSRFQTEPLPAGVVQLGGFTYRPAEARLVIPGGRSAAAGDLRPVPPRRALVPPASAEEADAWIAEYRAGLAGRGGLHLTGGRVDLPWPEAPPLPAPREGAGDGGGGLAAIQVDGTPLSDVVQAWGQRAAVVLTSSGADGLWLLERDTVAREVAGFRARIGGAVVEFDDSAVARSLVEGDLLVPYPVDLALGFRGEVDASGQILVGPDGLVPPDASAGWPLRYWSATLHPRAAADGAAPGVVLDGPGRRIVIQDAGLALAVPDAYGGVEFRADGAEHPFTVTLDIYPDGNIGYDRDPRGSPPIAPAGSGLRFLGIPFTPEVAATAREGETALSFRRYVGDHRPPPPDAPPTRDWRVRLDGRLAFQLFKPRHITVFHTALGAMVPYVEPQHRNEDGAPEPIVGDPGGAIYIDATLKFLNTYGTPDTVVDARLAGSADSDRYDEAQPKQFKAFLGKATVEVLGALSFNGLAEVGQYLDADGVLTAYEKVGAGAGVDIVKAALAALHIGETAARLGGSIAGEVTGAEGVGAEVINVATEAAAFASSVVTTVAAAAATGASAGGAGGVGVEEVRALVGNGLSLAGASVDLLKALYLSPDLFKPSPEATDPEYVAMELADIAITAANMGVQFDEITPEQAAALVLQTLDTAIPILQSMQYDPPEVDAQVDLALQVAKVLVTAARALVERGTIDPTTAWRLADASVDVVRRYAEIESGNPALGALPLAVALAQTGVAIGQGVNAGTPVDLAQVVDLADEVSAFVCANPEVGDPLTSGDAPVTTRQEFRNVAVVSRQVFASLKELVDGGAADPAAVAGALVDVLDPLAGSAAGQVRCGAVTARVDYGRFDAQVKAALRLGQVALRGVSAVPEGNLGTARWGADLLVQVANTVRAIAPGTLAFDEVAALRDLRRALAQLDDADPPPVQVLQVGSQLARPLGLVARRATGDRTAVRYVHIVAGILDALVPLADADRWDGLATWGRSLDGVVAELQGLPGAASDPLLSDGLAYTRGVLQFIALYGAEIQRLPEVLQVGLELIDLLIRADERGGLTASLDRDPVLVAWAGDDRALARFLPAAAPGRAAGPLRVAAAVLRGALGVFEAGGLTPPVVARMLDDLATAYQPAGEFTAPLAAALRAVDPVWADRPPADTYPRTLEALLETEADRVVDPAGREAVARALYVLRRPPASRVGVWVTRAGGTVRRVRQVDLSGVERTLDLERGGVLSVRYPDDHPDFPGLRELHVLDGVEDLPEDRLTDLAGVEQTLATDATVQEREYRDGRGGRVSYNRQLGEVVKVTAGRADGTFVPYRLLLVAAPPPRGTPGDEISGTLLEARWLDAGGRRIAFQPQMEAVSISDPATGERQLRFVAGDVPFTDVAAVPLDGRLLAYEGPLPGRPDLRVRYTAGRGTVHVAQGESFDVVAFEPAEAPTDPAGLEVGGALLERQVVFADGTRHLYRPGEFAAYVAPDGSAEIYAFPAVPPGAAVPAPDQDLAHGPLLLRATASGDVVDAQGVSLFGDPAGAGTVAEQLGFADVVDVEQLVRDQLESTGLTGEALDARVAAQMEAFSRLAVARTPEGGIVVTGGTGEPVFAAADGAVTVYPEGAAPRSEQAVDGRRVTTWSDRDGQHRRTAWILEGGQPAVLNVTTRPGGDVELVFATPEETTRRLATAAGREVIDIERADGTRYHAEYDRDEPAVSYPGPPGRVTAPSEDDPLYAHKTAFLNALETARAAFAGAPSDEGAGRLLALWAEAEANGWAVDGVGPQVLETLAAGLSALVDDALAAVEARASDPTAVTDWLTPPPEGDNPIAALLGHLALAQETGLVVADRVGARLGLALRRTYLALRERMATAPQPDDGARLLGLNTFVQQGVVDPELVYGAENLAAAAAADLALLCQAARAAYDRLEGLLADPNRVFVTADARAALAVERDNQMLGCPAVGEALSPAFAAVGYRPFDATDLALRVTERISADLAVSTGGTERASFDLAFTSRLAEQIARYGLAGRAAAVERLGAAVDALPEAEDSLDRLLHYLFRVRRLQEVPLPAEADRDPSWDAVWEGKPDDLGVLEDAVVARIRNIWTAAWNGAALTLVYPPDDAPPVADRVAEVARLARLGTRVERTLGRPDLDVDGARDRLRQRLADSLTGRLDRYLDELGRAADPVVDPADPSVAAVRDVADTLRLLADAVPGWAPFTADDALLPRLRPLLEALPPAPSEADLAPLAPWPDLAAALGADRTRAALGAALDDRIATLVERGRSGAVPWEYAVRAILRIHAAAQRLGWDLPALSASAGADLLPVLREAYTTARRAVDGGDFDGAARELLSVLATAQMLGVELLPVDGFPAEADLAAVVDHLGARLEDRAAENARCVAVGTCLTRNLEEALRLAADAQLLGADAPAVERHLHAVVRATTAAASGDWDGQVVTPVVLEQLATRNADARGRAAGLLERVAAGLDPRVEGERRLLRVLADRARILAAQPLNTPGAALPSPDPLAVLADALEARLGTWAGTDLAARLAGIAGAAGADAAADLWRDYWGQAVERLPEPAAVRELLDLAAAAPAAAGLNRPVDLPSRLAGLAQRVRAQIAEPLGRVVEAARTGADPGEDLGTVKRWAAAAADLAALPAADLPTVASLVEPLLAADLAALPEHPTGEQWAAVGFWPALLDELGAEGLVSRIGAAVDARVQAAVAAARADPTRWSASVREILDAMVVGQQFGWDAPSLAAGPSATALEEVLRDAYGSVRDRLLADRDDAAIREMMALLATAQLLGADLSVGGYLPGADPESAVAVVGSVLVERSAANAACVAEGACLKRHLETALFLETQAQLLGFDGSDAVRADREAVQEVALATDPESDYAALCTGFVLQEKAEEGPAGRAAAARWVGARTDELDPTDSDDFGELQRLYRRVTAVAALPVDYPVPSPDPLAAAAAGIQGLLERFAATQLDVTELIRKAVNGDVDDLFDQLDRLAVRDGASLATAAQSGQVLSVEAFAEQDPGARYEAVAAALEPARAVLGSHGLLAGRLAARLPDPAASAADPFRDALAAELARFVVEEGGLRPLGLVQPGASTAEQLAAQLSPEGMLTGAFTLLKPRPGFSPGQALARMFRTTLAAAGLPSTGWPGGAASLLGGVVDGVLSAGYQGTVAGNPIDWNRVLRDAVTPLSSGTSGFWVRLVADTTLLGLAVAETGGPSDPEAQGREAVDLLGRLVQEGDFQTTVDGLPEPVRTGVRLAAQVPVDALSYAWTLQPGDTADAPPRRVAGDPILYAFLKAAANALFPSPGGAPSAGRELSHWALDLVAGQEAALAQGPEQGLPALAGALVAADGAPKLACILDRHVDGLDVTPRALVAPFVLINEVAKNAALLGTDDAPRVLIDVAAGGADYLYSRVPLSCGDGPFAGVEPSALGILIRQFKDLESVRDPFELAGRVAVAAVYTAEALAGENPHTLSRVLKVLWWGAQADPATWPPARSVGVYHLLAGQVQDPVTQVQFALGVPKMAGEVIDILSSDPALQKPMRLLSGSCEKIGDQELLLAPDACDPGEGKGARNLILGALGDLRRTILPDLPDDAHANDEAWGYLRTLPILAGADADGVPVLANLGDEDLWADTVARVNNLNRAVIDPAARAAVADDAKKAVVGVIDLARMAVSFVDRLPTGNQVQVGAEQVLADSVFTETIGGATFTGIGGGVWRRWSLAGGGVRPLDERVRLELVGRFTLPALLKVAAQFTYETLGPNEWLVKIQAGGNYPDLDAGFQSIGVSVPANQLAESLVGGAEAELFGWLGHNDAGAYARLWAYADANLGALPLGRVNLSGFMTVPAAANGRPLPPEAFVRAFDAGMCGDLALPVVPPPFSLLSGGLTAEAGGYFYKQGDAIGFGAKGGAAVQVIIPMFPAAGLELGLALGQSGDAVLSGTAARLGLGMCVSPWVRGYFLGFDVESPGTGLEAQYFGAVDTASEDAEVGIKFRLSIPDVKTDLPEIDCTPIPEEDALARGVCEGLQLLVSTTSAGQSVGAWGVLGTKGFSFGLGEFPTDPESWVLHMPVSGGALAGITVTHPSPAWVGWSPSPYNVCDRDMCAGRDGQFRPDAAVPGQVMTEPNHE